ncbi:type I 3-dehydroquinate dehydratase [Lacrimispora sp. NSJ-141]|uniref:3-dehydroquinate dehydratase n=1 Tax=Lientehia hominis TaxID=2897778 RepID=A0AAP2RJC4_9FIRM|nr:type I 3-dehydroquinate dehydratase [Lientehia hominis]MCD2493042.1 type I 3-dehydroquinate dehydratase [Lientehia hominis]
MKPLTIRSKKLGEGIPKLCIPITGRNEPDILEAAGRISGLPHDAIEWRADHFRDVTKPEKVRRILAQLRQILPDSLILFTFRTMQEGGRGDLSAENYLALNEMVLRSGMADLLDLELYTGTDLMPEDLLASSPLHPLLSLARQKGIPVILSSHDFEKTPPEAELISRLCLMESMGCGIAKLAVMPHTKKDVLALLSATLRASESLSCPIITMSMGPLGVISRVGGEFFGSCLTFGTSGQASAPGQLDAEKLADLLRLLHT